MKKANQNGTILLIFLLTLPFLILLALYYMRLSMTSFQVARFDELHTQAQLAADAGADYAVEQINQNSSWAGTTGEVQLHSDSTTRTTYEVGVTSTANTKVLSITGRTYWPAGTTTAARSVHIYVDLRPVTTGNYSIVSGEGGLVMSNSAKIVGGDVFVNGGITMTNNSQIGLSTQSLSVKVADQMCPSPPDSTYPRICNSGEGSQPVSISGQAAIYGTVIATNQTSGSRMYNPGLTSGSVTPLALPTYNRTAQENAVSTTWTPSTATCATSNGSITWPANLKITGDVNLNNGCKVTLSGNVWITGSLQLSQSSQIIVPDSLNTTQPVIMVDGAGGLTLGNNSTLASNSSNTGVEVITFWSAASCSPDCSSVTGTDLYNSRSVTTISLNNNSSAPNSLLYAYWSQISLGNSGQVGALVGQTVNLSNNATIAFGTSVSGLATTTWVIKGYRRY